MIWLFAVVQAATNKKKKKKIRVIEIFWVRNEYCFNMIFLLSAFYRNDSTHFSNIQCIFSFWHYGIEMKQQSEMKDTVGNLWKFRHLFFSGDEIPTNGICEKISSENTRFSIIRRHKELYKIIFVNVATAELSKVNRQSIE